MVWYESLQYVFLHFVITVTLRFDSKIIPSVGYRKVIPYSKFEHFGIICVRVVAWTNQTNKQPKNHTPTDADDHLTHASTICVSNYTHLLSDGQKRIKFV